MRLLATTAVAAVLAMAAVAHAGDTSCGGCGGYNNGGSVNPTGGPDRGWFFGAVGSESSAFANGQETEVFTENWKFEEGEAWSFTDTTKPDRAGASARVGTGGASGAAARDSGSGYSSATSGVSGVMHGIAATQASE